MNSSIHQPTVAMMITFLNKTFRHACEGLYVDDKSVLDLKALLANENKKVVLVPSYQSILDIFVILYALYDNGIGLPFTFGPDEDAIQNLI
jgi:glycerol-3-phosphate O-acyltransferase